MTVSDAASRRLFGNASNALAWSLINTIVSRLGALGIGIALARLLGPAEFGTYAVAFVALIAVLSCNELGVSLAIVRWPGDPGAIAPTVTTISLLSSALITVFGILVAPAFTAAMGSPEATGVVRLLALSVLISGAVATPAALLQRQFQQARRMLVDQVGVWVGAVSSIVLAVLGTGAMSLAVGRVAGAAVTVVLFVWFSPEPYRLGWDRAQLVPLLRFGLPLAGASLVVFAVGYADQLVVGRSLGPTELGFYVLAVNLSNWPVSVLSQPLRGVAPATFARLQHEPARMRSTLVSLTGILAAVTLPACLLLAGAAAPLVAFVYGPAWGPAAAALAWLGGLAALRIFTELAYDYLVVVGDSGGILRLQLWWLVPLVPALVVGAELGGIAGVAAAQVVVAAAVVLPLYLRRLGRAGVSGRSLLRRVRLPAAAAAGVGLAAAVLARQLHPPLAALGASGAVAAAAVAALLYRDRAELRRLRGAPGAEAADAAAAAAPARAEAAGRDRGAG